MTDGEWEALRLSLSISLHSVLFALPFAVLIAWLLTRRRFAGRFALDALVHLPLVLPPVVVGYLLLLLLGTRGPLGSWLLEHLGVRLAFTRTGAAIATAVMSFPLMVRAIRIALEGVDRGLEDAARTLGAGSWDRFATITLPLMAPGVLAGAITAYAAGLGEFGAVITFVGNVAGETQTLPLALYSALQTPNGDAAAMRLAGLSLVLGIAGLIAAEFISRALGRRLGRRVPTLMLSVEFGLRRGDFNLQMAFEAAPGGVVALFGRSGCGKSSTVDIIAGLLKPERGRVVLGDRILFDSVRGIDIPTARRRIGYVFQNARLFPHYSVRGNLQYGLRRAHGRAVRQPFEAVVDLLGLGSLLERRSAALSGGEQQRVALGRALLSQPELLLLDEPLASLDQARRNEVLPYLERVREHLRIPIVYVSHQYEEVLQLATSVVLMSEGRVIAQQDPSEISLNPQLRGIVGSELIGSVVEGHVESVDAAEGLAILRIGNGRLSVQAPELSVGARVRVQLLARDLILALHSVAGLSVRNQIAGTVRAVEEDGHNALVRVDVGGADLLARVTSLAARELGLRPGLGLYVLVKTVTLRGHVFRTPPAP